MTFKEALRNFQRLLFSRPTIRSESTDYEVYWKNPAGKRFGQLNSFQQFRSQWAALHMANGDTFLDIGSGDGSILLDIEARTGARGRATDFSPTMLKVLTERGVPCQKMDVTDPNAFDGTGEFDYILMFEILEHMQNPEVFVGRALGKARKGVLFSIPNTGFIAYRLRLLFGSFPVQWRIHPGEHLRYWTFRDLKWWLRELGYEDRATIHCYEGMPLLNKLWPSMFGMGLVCHIKQESTPARGSVSAKA